MPGPVYHGTEWRPRMKHMKGWGWGEEGGTFRYNDKPGFAGFIKGGVEYDGTKESAVEAHFDSLPIPCSQAPPELRASLEAAVGADNVKDDAHDRVVHAYGKGLRDLVRIRSGDVGRLPDLIVYPGSENEIVGI